MDRVCHFEIPYDDKERAARFYQNVFGWEIEHMEGMDYSMVITTPTDEMMQCKEPGGINGGMYKRGDDGSPTPVVVMQVDSCEQRIKDVEAAGGSAVVPLREMGGMGLYAQVKDTEGNIVGLWQPLQD